MAIVKMKRKGRRTKNREIPENIVEKDCSEWVKGQILGKGGFGSEYADVVKKENSEWIRGGMLGRGGFGSVYLAASVKSPNFCFKGLPSNSIMAVKSTLVSASDELRSESSLLENFTDCPFVIRRYGEDTTVGRDGNRIFNVFLEFADGGTMGDLIQRCGGCGLGEIWQVKKYTDSILQGLKCIHQRGYVHCDIKPDNILLVTRTDADATEHVPKIGDFGLSKRAGSPGRGGTALYFSPEAAAGYQEPPSDIWALGCVVLEMITGRKLWEVKAGAEPSDILSLIASESPVIPGGLSVEARDFLEKCFVRDPLERYTADMLLSHQWVTQIDGIGEVQPLKDVPSVSSSKEAAGHHPDYPSYIPLGSYSSEKADEMEEKHRHPDYPSFIPLGSCSSEEADEMEEKKLDSYELRRRILPWALLYPKSSSPRIPNAAVCPRPIIGAA